MFNSPNILFRQFLLDCFVTLWENIWLSFFMAILFSHYIFTDMQIIIGITGNWRDYFFQVLPQGIPCHVTIDIFFS